MRLTKYERNLWDKCELYWSFSPTYLCSDTAVVIIHSSITVLKRNKFYQ